MICRGEGSLRVNRQVTARTKKANEEGGEGLSKGALMLKGRKNPQCRAPRGIQRGNSGRSRNVGKGHIKTEVEEGTDRKKEKKHK